MSLIGAFQPGSSVLHRIPAGPKLLGMIAVSALVVAFRSWQTTVALLVFDVLLVVIARVAWRRVVPPYLGMWVTMALLAAYQIWQHGLGNAFTVVGSLLGLIALAAVFTATTSADELLGTITRVVRPFRVVGVNPELVALAFSLLIRGVPTTLDLAHETRQAALARGLERNVRAHLTPWVIRVVAHARATGDALHARGVGD